MRQAVDKRWSALPALLGASTSHVSVKKPSAGLEARLMQMAQEGDRKAFADIYQQYSPAILSYLYRMLGSLEDVEAIGQEVFLRAFRSRATYRYPQSVATWLYTIARNLAINQAKRRKRNPARCVTELKLDGIDVQGRRDPMVSALDAAEKNEDISRVVAALDQLSSEQKEAIILGVFENLSYAEMEQITGAKAVTLRSRMFHGLRKLAKIVEPTTP